MKRLDDSLKRRTPGVLKKALAVVLCFSMISGAGLSISGCKVIDDLRSGFKATQKPLSETELARVMASAISSDANVADCFAKVPASQLDGLSYSMFYEYCSILRKTSEEHGTADSFRILNATDKRAYFSSIDSENTADFKTVGEYGDMDVIELCYSEDKDKSAPPVRFMIAKDGGNYSIAGKYITDSMLAYSYINHYFEMIDSGNVNGLEAIIKSSYDSDIYINSVIYEKANYISEYYRMKVKTVLDDYELKLFTPTHISYVIPEVISQSGDKIISKTVDLRLKNDGSYLLEDDIPASISEIRFFKNGGTRMRMGSTYTSSEIYRLLGNPIIESYMSGVVILTYSGMTMRLETDPANGKNWTSGRLSSVVIRNDETFSLGENLYIGMNVSELLLIYPMFDKCEFTSSFRNGDGEFILSFRFDDYGNVTRIRLGEKIN